MKLYKILFITLAILSSVFYYGCDDSGIVKPTGVRGSITFSQTNLKPLSTGAYELWLSIVDTSNTLTWYTLGQFNINSAGAMVNSNGEPMTFTFLGDTNLLNGSRDILVTYEVDNDFQPSNYRLMSGPLTVTADTIGGELLMSGSEAFGSMGSVLTGNHSNPPVPATGSYHLGSPTTNNAECLKGIWFCDTAGNSSFTGGLDMPGWLGWKYQTWIVNNTTGQNTPLGYFTSFDNADENGAGPCAGPNGAYSKPGQDFASGCPTGDNLNTGNYGVFITIEPAGVSLSEPFVLKIFNRPGGIVPSLPCRVTDPFFRNLALEDAFPRGRVRIFN